MLETNDQICGRVFRWGISHGWGLQNSPQLAGVSVFCVEGEENRFGESPPVEWSGVEGVRSGVRKSMAHADQLAFSESVDDTDEDKISAGSPLDIQWYKQLQSFPTNRRNSELDWLNEEVKEVAGKF